MGSRVTGATILLPDAALSDADLASNAAIALTKLAQRAFAEWPILFTMCRVWDALATLPVTTAAADDLALITGTPGTNAPTISTGDVKAAGATSRKIGFEVVLPANYEAGETIQVSVRGGMETTIADTAATVDLEAWAADGDGAVSADLVSTAAQNCNSLTKADFTFSITPTGRLPGDRLLCVLTLAVNDAATGGAVIAVVTELRLQCDTRG